MCSETKLVFLFFPNLYAFQAGPAHNSPNPIKPTFRSLIIPPVPRSGVLVLIPRLYSPQSSKRGSIPKT